MDPSYVSNGTVDVFEQTDVWLWQTDRPFLWEYESANNRKCCTVGSHKVIDV